MNERIEELIEQADNIEISPDEEFCDTDFLADIDPRRVKKFAELIVRECIERVREQYIPIRDQTIEGKPSPIHTQLRLRTQRETGIIECGVNSVISLEELIQEQTDKWYKENILGVEE